MTTTYTYDFESLHTQARAGDLINVVYTPGGSADTDLTFSYYRWGGVKDVIDATGFRRKTYDSNKGFRLAGELLSPDTITNPPSSVNGTPVNLAGALGRVDKTVINIYSALGQLTGTRVEWEDTAVHQDVDTRYAYDAKTGRLDEVRRMGAVEKAFVYTYKPSSHLVDTIAGPRHTVSNSYEQHRDLRTRVLSNNGTSDMVDHHYSYNKIGQRDAGTYDGKVYDTQDGSWRYIYNENGELFHAGRSETPSLNANDLTRLADYQFDPIGNRISVVESDGSSGSDTWNYFADTGTSNPGGNADNQYNRIDTPAGTVNRVHDDDGNLTDDGTNLYTWTAENRLASVTRKVGSLLVAKYHYDYIGRRVWKQTTAAAPQGASERIFVYHGWNLVAEYDASSSGRVAAATPPTRSYTWGPDLSGSLQGAGGVGGLLAIEEHAAGTHTGIHYPAYDANGNVVAILDDTDGSKDAAYVYDPFGKEFAGFTNSGAYAGENPFRFSTKYHDEETGWYYYGFRYYQSNTGRWLSRDPIGEDGGVNLYGFVGNDGVNRWDLLGLTTLKVGNIAEIPDNGGSGLLYSCRCGWIDGQHLSLGQVSVRNLISQIGEYEGGLRDELILEQYNRKSLFGVEVKQGFKETYRPTYQGNLNNHQKAEMSVGIFLKWASGFEDSQAQPFLPSSTDSSFSPEDMPSNYLGAMIEISRQFGGGEGKSWRRIKEICGVLNVEDSTDIMLNSKQPKQNRSHKPVFATDYSTAFKFRRAKCPCKPDPEEQRIADKLFDRYPLEGQSDKYFRTGSFTTRVF